MAALAFFNSWAAAVAKPKEVSDSMCNACISALAFMHRKHAVPAGCELLLLQLLTMLFQQSIDSAKLQHRATC